MLIIWDRLFGTFVPEDEQRDFYGLAKPAETFDPVAINAEHWRRLENVGAARASPFWGRLAALFRRRVEQPWKIDPAALWAPLPTPKRSLWILPEAPARPKYDGHNGSPPVSLQVSDSLCGAGKELVTTGPSLPLQVYVGVHGVLTIAAGYLLTAFAEALPLGAVVPAAAAVVVSLAILGRLLDDSSRLIGETIRVSVFASLPLACQVLLIVLPRDDPIAQLLRRVLNQTPPLLGPILNDVVAAAVVRFCFALALFAWWIRVFTVCATTPATPRTMHGIASKPLLTATMSLALSRGAEVTNDQRRDAVDVNGVLGGPDFASTSAKSENSKGSSRRRAGRSARPNSATLRRRSESRKSLPGGMKPGDDGSK